MISTDIHKSSLQVGSDIWYSQPLSLAKPLRSATERNHRGHHSSTSQFFRSCEWNAELQDLAICQQDKGEPSPFFFKISLKNPKHLKSHITTWPKLKFPTALLRANRASLGEEKSSGVFFFFNGVFHLEFKQSCGTNREKGSSCAFMYTAKKYRYHKFTNRENTNGWCSLSQSILVFCCLQKVMLKVMNR